MPRRVALFHRLAVRDYRSAAAWFAARSPSTSTKFLADLDRTVGRIEADADSCPPGLPGSRWAPLKTFKYLVHFVVVDDARVRIVGVGHASRRPGYWVRRLNRP